MNLLINHCWCSDSIWGGVYHCRVIVTLNRVPEGKTYYDPPCPDWALVEEVEVNEAHPHHLFHDTLRLRKDVSEWLHANVKDRPHHRHDRGWAVGTDAYNSHSGIQFSLFFQSARDAMAFIKRWSVYKRPLHYLNYFRDLRREYDPQTKRLKMAKKK